MKSDKRIANAIHEATKEREQSESLGNRILAWFNDLRNGNISLAQKDEMQKFIELLYNETSVPADTESTNEK